MIVRVGRCRTEPARIVYWPRSGGQLTARVLLGDGQVVGPDAGVEVLVADADQLEALKAAGYSVPPADLDAR